jgi:hypothetical protein
MHAVGNAMSLSRRNAMRVLGLIAAAAIAILGETACTPDWATENDSPFIMEISAINGGNPVLSDVSTMVNDDVSVDVNVLRKNNNPDLGVSPVEHLYLESYEVRFTRSDGRNQEGVEVPYRITGPLGNLRFHTASPGGQGEVEQTVSITIVRNQAKLEPPLINLKNGGGSIYITTIAEVTVFGRTIQGKGLKAVGNVQVTFGDFPDSGSGGGTPAP